MKLTNKHFIIIGLLASIVVGIGEYLLHFSPTGPRGEIEMLLDIPLEKASIGHFFVVLGAPLYFAGYYGIKRIFSTTSTLLSNLIFIAGVLSFSIGGVWVSSRYFAAVVLQKSIGTEDYAYYLSIYEDHYQILVWLLRIFIGSISLLYVLLILKNSIGYPKWLAVFNPLILLLLVFSTLFWFKPLGIHIAPIAMNVVHFIFFAIILKFTLKKN